MSSPKILTYKTDPRAGEIKAEVHVPSGSSEAAHPVVLMFHGGGCISGSTSMMPPAEIDYLVNTLGFVAVNAEYRLSPQVGMYDGALTDAKDLLVWARTTLPGLLDVKVDGEKIVAMGQSAGGNIAMTLGAAPNPPKAIMDLYGSKFLSDKYYSTPHANFAMLPELRPEFINQVYDAEGPIPTSSPAAFKDGKPDFMSSPRNGFMFMGMKHGTIIADAVVDGNFDRCDPMTMLHKDWPPTYFLHGTGDFIVPPEFSTRASEKLTALGVKNVVALVEGKPHGYDMAGVKEGEDGWEEIRKGLEFLKKHVE